jgi:hypothetical protein
LLPRRRAVDVFYRDFFDAPDHSGASIVCGGVDLIRLYSGRTYSQTVHDGIRLDFIRAVAAKLES